jgi:hypothetical protein
VSRTRSSLLSLAALTCIVMLVGCGNSSDLTNSGPTNDGTPPPAPEGLARADVAEYNEIVWAPSAASDVTGYQVYEYQPDPSREHSYVLVGEVTEPSYRLPRNLDIDGYYRVRAVDASGNTSALSEQYHAEFGALFSGGGGGVDVPSDEGDNRRRIEE